jgi:presenilin-like A22 family membrane protease
MSKDFQNQSQAEIIPSLIHPWRAFGFEAIFFSLSLGLGILAGLRLQEIWKFERVTPPSISLWQFLFYFLLGTLFLLSIIYFFKFKKSKAIFFKVIFLLAIGFGNLFFFGLWLPDLATFILVALLLFSLFKKPSLIIHNLVLIFAVAGIGAGLGLGFTPEMVILLLLIFSIYDFIAVYKTKHMVKMAKEMVEQGAILGFVVPQKISDFPTHLKEVKPGGKFLILGAGDIVFPLIFSCSLIPQGISDSLIVASFSLLGLLVGFLIFISKPPTSPGGGRQPMPALPPIALFSIIGYLITRII